ncbi:MAG TPA: hypothetical protein VGF82_12530 [Terracidiphilus sp.]|jgi:hypothetical protein
MTSNLRILTIAGLIAGAVLGMAGSMVTAQDVRAVCWAIDSTGLIIATTILALAYGRSGRLEVAAGFLIYAIGEAVMLSGTSMSLEASVPSFAAGTALWAASLTLTSVPRVFALWTRLAGMIAAVLFGIVSLSIFRGLPLTPIARPLPFFAYPFLVLTFIGWIVAVVKTPAVPARSRDESKAEMQVR